jgi:hypothetical protein
VAIGDTARDLHREDGKGTISHLSENMYLRVRITKDGNHEPEISYRINRGRAAISKDEQLYQRTISYIKERAAISKDDQLYQRTSSCIKTKQHFVGPRSDF